MIQHALRRHFSFKLQRFSPPIPQNYAFYFRILPSCPNLNSLLCIHAQIVTLGLTHNNLLQFHLINAYSSFKRCNFSRFILDSMQNPRLISFNSMIRAYTRSNEHKKALDLYREMLGRGIGPDKFTFTFVIKACAGELDFEVGVDVHNEIVRRGLQLDLYIATGLVDMYCKMGRLNRAKKVFDEMPQRDVVSWNAMIAGLAQSEGPDEAMGVFYRMQLSGVEPNSVSLLNLFPAVCKLGDLRLCRSVHSFVIRRGFRVEVYNGLIDMYCKCQCPEVGGRIFDRMEGRDDVSWGTMMAGYVHNGYFEEVLELFDQMKGGNMMMNKVSVVSASMAAAEMRDLEEGKEIYELAKEHNIGSDILVATALMTMYAKCGDFQKAKELFDGLKEKDLVAWSALMAAFAQSGFPDEALSIFREMLDKRLKPSSVTLMSVLPACGALSYGRLGKSLHCYSINAGIDSEVAITSALVSMYSKCGLFTSATFVFRRMPFRDVVTWNALISGYAQVGHPYHAMDLFHELRSSGMKPDLGTMVGMIPACALAQDLDDGTFVHALVIKYGLESDCHVKNALIDMYAKCGKLLLAESLFNDIDYTKHEVSWNAMIAGYAQNGRSKDAILTFSQMKSEGLKPNAVSIVSVLPAIADLASLRDGMVLHAYAIQMGFQSNVLVGNSLIDMYAKCGRFDCSEKYFDSMEKKDTVSWNALLAGYAAHGQAKYAIALFSKMQKDNVMADSVSFLSILSACRHGGLVEEGKKIFKSMRYTYHIEPKLEHYACMVDMLARNGLLKETMDLIDSMPMEPDGAVWGALLGACRMHSHEDLAKVALHHLLKLEPENPAHYIGLSNIYAQSGRWVEARNTRLKLHDSGLKKIPGYSWV